ncbi:MAG: hypothetical protein KDD64_06405, partial [Bdellovibrionales bacterium]|nr:hypothetical protein [Bdellovibrionales bacterium]
MNRLQGMVRRLMSVLALVIVLVAPSSAFAQENFLRVQRASDIPRQFDPDKPLIVKGRVPLGDGAWSDRQLEGYGQQLAELNRTRKQPVTVLLIDTWEGESFRLEQQTLTGYTAIQAMVETGLKSNSAFAERDFAVLCICFTPWNGEPSRGQRPFEYWASKQLKQWRLDVPQIWAGDLKEFVVTRLKARNIDRAFLDTALELNNRLDRNIQAEEARVAQLRREGEAALRDAESKYQLLVTNLGKLRSEFPGRNGDVFFPELAPIESGLETARDSVQTGNFAQAKASGAAVVAAVASRQELIDQYRAAPATIEALQARLTKLAKHPFFDKARSLSETASKTAEEVLEKHNLGSSAYLSLLGRLEEQVQAAESRASSAQMAHRAFVATVWMVIAITFGVLAVIVVILRRLSTSGQNSFRELYLRRKNAIDEMRGGLAVLQRKKVKVIGANKAKSDVASTPDDGSVNQTEKDADRAGTLVGDVFLLFGCADHVLTEALKKATPKTLVDRIRFAFSGSPWNAAKEYLNTTPVKFEKQSGIRFALAENKEVSETEVLWQDISVHDPFEMGFTEVIAAIAKKSKEADSLLDSIDLASQKIGPALIKLSTTLHGTESSREGSLDARYAAACAVWIEDGHNVLNEYTDTLIPALDKEINRLSKLGEKDPVGAYNQIGKLSDRIKATEAMIEQIEAVAGVYDDISAGYDVLTRHRVNGEWAKVAYNAIMTRCDAQMRIIASDPDSNDLPRLAPVDDHIAEIIGFDPEVNPHKLIAARQADALVRRVNEAAELAGRLREMLETGVSETASAVESARTSIASGIEGVQPNQILTEVDQDTGRDLNPDLYLDAASRFIITGAEELAEGDVDAASKAYRRGAENLQTARDILSTTIAAHEAYKGRVEAINSRGEELADEVEPHRATLAGIEAEFDPAVLLLTAGDEAHPDANGTIGDNFDEIATAVTLRGEHLREASEEYSQGFILEAAKTLNSAEATNEFIKHRLDGIAKKRNRLDATVERNAEARVELERNRARLARATADPKVMRPTTAQYDNAAALFSQTLALFEAEKTNPFAIESALAQVKQAFWSVDERIKLDLELHAEADRSLAAASKRLTRAQRVLSSVSGMADNIPDSDRLSRVPSQLHELERDLARAKVLFEQESGDWNEVDSIADRITERAQALIDVINVEAQDGQSAVAAISSAAQAVRKAINWSGSYGVSLLGQPGSRQLDSARTALERGEYDEASSLASRAMQMALSAISAAEAEVTRRRRAEEERIRRERERQRQEEEERRRAAERRRREAARRSSYSSSSSSSSWGSSGGGGGFGGFSSGGGGGGF